MKYTYKNFSVSGGGEKVSSDHVCGATDIRGNCIGCGQHQHRCLFVQNNPRIDVHDEPCLCKCGARLNIQGNWTLDKYEVLEFDGMFEVRELGKDRARFRVATLEKANALCKGLNDA